MKTPSETLIRYTEINGIPVEVTVKVYVEEDHVTDPFDMDFDSETSKKSYTKRFENGELFNAWINVVAEAHGVIGSDALCGIHMHCNNAFNSKPFETDLKNTLEDHEMINNAIEQLRIEIIARANDLNQFASK